ncbi:H-type small acid-soluble spore protein [Gracilibacillus halotolerans]|uniref:H-type small acid-soluble spore protein n=1 Tax=Gracilibacillus halotolerans TaxID=74386 RepID=A0A841RMS3_9BACI|nr:H-type small acid-soluble spore protein [Gracilibacillus halotolerans]MBB6512465.1 H-type small acid-soluble spore protein [Gracilibacillus halotolerans]
MNIMRAKEIKDDPVMQEVKYKDKFVYIDDVDEDTQRATVHFTNKSEEKFEVAVQDLVELD